MRSKPELPSSAWSRLSGAGGLSSGQDQVSVAFGLIGGTLLAAAGYAWTGRQ